MTDLERIKKDVVEMDSRANVRWYDTKVLTKAVRLILEELTADRKTENSSEKPNNCDEPQTENLFTDKYGDVWEWRGDAWYCISGDEPQTETEIAKEIVHKMIDDAVIAEDAYPDLRQKMHDAVDEYEQQTDCAWK